MRKSILSALALLLIGPTVDIVAVEAKKRGVDVTSGEISADSLLQEADAAFKAQHHSTALEQYQEALKAARNEFNNSIEVEALAQIARTYLVLGNREEGWLSLTDAEAKATDSDPMGWSRYLSVKGRYQWKDGDLKAAAKTFDAMYTYCNVNALWGRAVDAANMLSIVLETPEEQIEWSQRGIRAAEAGGEESWLGPLWNNLAVVYYETKKYDSAVQGFLKAREYHWRFSGELAKLFADYHLGMAYRAAGDLAEAQKWLRPTLAWAERLENHSIMGQALEDLGEIEIANGNQTTGLKMLRRARDEYQLEEFDKAWPEIWEAINKRIRELGG
ncbi:MAG: tetratricopeptide repeat protein [candidate division Zixibacteria bacterium]|nr:tetratricopeptide repeat protein [candidate division Zixibacteria bacterium]